eukprot:1481733-Pyramimonas_sp.AAC.1
MVQTYGPAMNCPRCWGGEAARSRECRARVEGGLGRGESAGSGPPVARRRHRSPRDGGGCGSGS